MIRTTLLFLCVVFGVYAHVPYIERIDYDPSKPFENPDPENSKAFYAYLESASAVDAYNFNVAQGSQVKVTVSLLIPFCAIYRNFRPYAALIGPGLPMPVTPLPVPLPEGYGVIVYQTPPPGTPVEIYFEEFSKKSYFSLLDAVTTVSVAGSYSLIVWDPEQKVGDYVFSIGDKEVFTAKDILRTAVNLPAIESGDWLHVPCPTDGYQPPGVAACGGGRSSVVTYMLPFGRAGD